MGFIQKLPTKLVSAFRATLEASVLLHTRTRTRVRTPPCPRTSLPSHLPALAPPCPRTCRPKVCEDADVVLHVVDSSSPIGRQQAWSVQQILREVGAEHTPQILALNKADAVLAATAKLPAPTEWVSLHDTVSPTYAVAISATQGKNLPKLLSAVEKAPPSRSRARGSCPALTRTPPSPLSHPGAALPLGAGLVRAAVRKRRAARRDAQGWHHRGGGVRRHRLPRGRVRAAPSRVAPRQAAGRRRGQE